MTEEERKTGAEGDESADTSTPFTPREDDESPLGSTDQHSKVDHAVDPADRDASGDNPAEHEPDLDELGEESFPASDAPGTY